MKQAVVLYDNDCGFCRWSVDRLKAWDRRDRLRAVALQSPEADDLLPRLSESERMASWFIVGQDGRVASAGSGVPVLLRLLPFGGLPAFVASLFPQTTERAYWRVARNRDRLGRMLGARACAVDPMARPQRGA